MTVNYDTMLFIATTNRTGAWWTGLRILMFGKTDLGSRADKSSGNFPEFLF